MHILQDTYTNNILVMTVPVHKCLVYTYIYITIYNTVREQLITLSYYILYISIKIKALSISQLTFLTEFTLLILFTTCSTLSLLLYQITLRSQLLSDLILYVLSYPALHKIVFANSITGTPQVHTQRSFRTSCIFLDIIYPSRGYRRY